MTSLKNMLQRFREHSSDFRGQGRRDGLDIWTLARLEGEYHFVLFIIICREVWRAEQKERHLFSITHDQINEYIQFENIPDSIPHSRSSILLPHGDIDGLTSLLLRGIRF